MSLISRIRTRTLQDLINEGTRVTVTGVASGVTSEEVILSIPEDRVAIITGYHLSSDSSTPELVHLGLKGGTPEVVNEFFVGYVSDKTSVNHSYELGDWRYGELGHDVIISVDGAIDVAYTIDIRTISELVPKGYIEQIGNKNHSNPFFGLESGRDRGQSEF